MQLPGFATEKMSQFIKLGMRIFLEKDSSFFRETQSRGNLLGCDLEYKPEIRKKGWFVKKTC